MIITETIKTHVFKWDDLDAPLLDGSHNSLISIYKKCLNTGYGEKVGAGWSIAFESLTGDTVVFKAPNNVINNPDKYLRISDDDGSKANVSGYTDMSDIDNGLNKLKLDSFYNYAIGNRTGKWLCIATDIGIWFLCEQRYTSSISKTGSFFYFGDTCEDLGGVKGLYLDHTSGSYTDGDYDDIMNYTGSSTRSYGKVLLNGTIYDKIPSISLFNGQTVYTDSYILLAPLYLNIDNKILKLPCITTSSKGSLNDNFDEATSIIGGMEIKNIIFSTSGRLDTNFAFNTTQWVV